MLNFPLLSLSFLAGVGVFFSPCGVALLPAYLGFLLGHEEGRTAGWVSRMLTGLKVGAVVSLGIISVFLTAGILVSALGNFLAPYAFWFGTLTGSALIVLGILSFTGKAFFLNLPHGFAKGKGFLKFYLFGAGYAVGGIGCTFPAFLLVVFSALSGASFMGGFSNFLAFSAGTSLLMLAITTATAVSKGFAQRWIISKQGLIQKLSALLIISAGIYLIYFNLSAFVF